MRALRLHGPHDLRLDDISEQSTLPGTVKVAIRWAGICGSDLMLYTAGAPRQPPALGEPRKQVLGHEGAGVVVELGPGVTNRALGEVVTIEPLVADGTCPACTRGEYNLCVDRGLIGVDRDGGCWSESVVVEADRVHGLPVGMGARLGALVEPLAVSWHAVRRAALADEGTAFIVGGGPIGLGVLLALRAQGASRVFLSEPSPLRRELAARLGGLPLDPAVANPTDAVMEATGGSGVDVSFDAAGVGAEAYLSTIDCLRRGGIAVQVGTYHGATVPTLDPRELMVSEKRVIGSYCYTADDFRAVIDRMASGAIDAGAIVTGEVILDQVVSDGIDPLLGEGRNEHVKILVSLTDDPS